MTRWAKDLRGVDLADVHAAPRQPQWDSPARSPSVWVFSLAMVVIIILTFAALECFEWIAGRWGG